MIVLEYKSTIEQSPLRFAEYTWHTEDTTHIDYLLHSIYLVGKSVYALNILDYEKPYNHVNEKYLTSYSLLHSVHKTRNLDTQ